jgi:hypothetical protein
LTKAATTSLSERAFQELGYAVAVFMLVLTVWVWRIETAALGAPLYAFLNDLDKLADILSDEQPKEIRDLSSIQSALNRASKLKLILPLAYALAYALAAAVAFAVTWFPPPLLPLRVALSSYKYQACTLNRT